MKNVYSASAILLGTFIFALVIGNSCKSTDNLNLPLSPNFPDYKIDYSEDIQNIQSQFDDAIWKTFIALVWPSDDLKPNSKGSILDQKDARSVFENYSYNYDLFLLNVNDSTSNYSPVGWGQTDDLNSQRKDRWTKWSKQCDLCPDLVAKAKKNKIKNLAEIIPLDEFIQASNDEKPHVPQIDLDSNFVWSSVIFNKVTYDFVKDNDLYNADGLAKAKKKLTLEDVYHVKKEKGDYVIDTLKRMVNFIRDNPGSMHLKTSWKILNPEREDTSKFHTAWGATVYNNLNLRDQNDWKPQCSLVRIGLVGMHISIKTKDQPDFIWATFEHVDNCPEKGNIEDKDYTFYDSASQRPINEPPKANDSIIGFRDPYWFNPNTKTTPSQIVREVPIPDETKALNKSYSDALGNSVWANYQLVGTQWKDPNSMKIYPKLLSNTTLETFDQLGSSCFGCHHQVTPNTLKGGPNDEQFTMAPYKVGNVLNLPLNIFIYPPEMTKDSIPIEIYSDYMWSLLKWKKYGHLTWLQVKK